MMTRLHTVTDISEEAFQINVTHLAGRLGWTWYHTHDARRSPAGFPDLILIRPPRLITAELKTQTGQPTPNQRTWLELLSAVPHIEVYLWRPSDLDTIAALLSRTRQTVPSRVLTREQP